MFKHLLKIMWNKRRVNALLFLEILLAFFILFAVFTFVTFSFDRYASPLGFAYEDALLVGVDLPDDLDSLGTLDLQERLMTELEAIPGVEAASFIGYVPPFSSNTWQNANNDNGFEISFKLFFADERMADVAELELSRGRWFSEEDKTAKYPPVVVNQAFLDAYYPDGEMVDSLINIWELSRIVGVVKHFKYYSNFAEQEPLVFLSQRNRELPGDAFQAIWLRTTPGEKMTIQETIYRTAVDLTKNTEVQVADLVEMRKGANRPTLIPLIIVTLISSFLLINIGLGLFGVLFTQINRRRAEIGLRKAMGATPGEITLQFILEVTLVTGAALLIGTFFAIQVPLLELLPLPGSYFYLGILAAAVTILLVILICAWVPSRSAAVLQPAVVLHED